MNVITSFENKIVKQAASLKHKKYREMYGEFIVEGKKNVLDSVAITRPKRVFLLNKEDLDLFSDCEVFLVSDEIMQKLADTVAPQSMIAVFDRLKPSSITSDYVVYLDRVRDPGNLGTIIRCCAAAGYQIILRDCVDIFNPKVVRSCMSGIFSVGFNYDGEYSISRLKAEGYEVLCADASGTNIFGYDKRSKRICLVIGNEAEGVDESIKNSCDGIISIPMESMESLNAAVSAAVLMFNLKFNGGK